MRKIILKVKWNWSILFIFLLAVSLLTNAKPISVRADANCPEIKVWADADNGRIDAPDPFPDTVKVFNYYIVVSSQDQFQEYIVFTGNGDIGEYKSTTFTPRYDNAKYVLDKSIQYISGFGTGRNTNESFLIGPHDITVKLYRNGMESDYCQLPSAYSFKSTLVTPTPAASCLIDVYPKSLTPLDPFKIVGTKVDPNNSVDRIMIEAYDETLDQIVESRIATEVNPTPTGAISYNFEASFGKKALGKYQITAKLQKRITARNTTSWSDINTCRIDITTCASGCGAPSPTPSPTLSPPTPTNPDICQACQRAFNPCADPQCQVSCNFCATPMPSPTAYPPLPSLAPLCEQLPGDFVAECKACIDPPKGGIWTAVGCIPVNFESFISDYVFKIGTGIAGGVAFLYFIFGVFQILTSAGNAEKIAQAKEIIMSAISGLLLIIFSILLLKVIGVDILRIPDFS